MKWKVKEHCQQFTGKDYLPPMTDAEIKRATQQLRKANYPKPTDCPERQCPEFRPACQLGICKIAVQLCGDW